MISQQLETLSQKLKKACQKAERPAQSVQLIAVSKKKPSTHIQEAFNAGQIHFGENYVQEFLEKQKQTSELKIQWHFIGHLQRNKVKDLIGKVHLIHTIDRLSLAQTINRVAQEKQIIQKALLQVKISNDPKKTGCEPDQVEQLIVDLKPFTHLQICGLMTVGSFNDDLEITRQEFKRLRQMQERINEKNLYHSKLDELSMGMSRDFEIAIAEGATLIRVGRDIFGER